MDRPSIMFFKRKCCSEGYIDPTFSRPQEASDQDELYRSCYMLLGNLYLTPEWTGSAANAGPGASGWVDFQVKSEGWVIKCTRDGNRLDKHIARFQPGGRYHNWIQSGRVHDFILLDFPSGLRFPERGEVSLEHPPLSTTS